MSVLNALTHGLMGKKKAEAFQPPPFELVLSLYQALSIL